MWRPIRTYADHPLTPPGADGGLIHSSCDNLAARNARGGMHSSQVVTIEDFVLLGGDET
jgi:hypothetical protein